MSIEAEKGRICLSEASCSPPAEECKFVGLERPAADFSLHRFFWSLKRNDEEKSLKRNDVKSPYFKPLHSKLLR